MRAPLSLVAAMMALAFGSIAQADTSRTITSYDELRVMTPTPAPQSPNFLRLRTMVRPADHLWMGPTIPSFVAPAHAPLDLELLDPRPNGGWVATYRETYTSCGFSRKNCASLVKLYDASGKETWAVRLDALLSRRDQLEVQDVRYVEDTGTLYFNEACQTYSADAGGRCSSLVAYDPIAKKVLWRTPSLVSNNEFMVLGNYIITGYGFTAEKCFVSVVRRSDGRVMDKQRLSGSNFEMYKTGDRLKILQAGDYGDANFVITGIDGASPKLVPLPNTKSTYLPKPYDPPLIPRPDPFPHPGF